MKKNNKLFTKNMSLRKNVVTISIIRRCSTDLQPQVQTDIGNLRKSVDYSIIFTPYKVKLAAITTNRLMIASTVDIQSVHCKLYVLPVLLKSEIKSPVEIRSR